MMVSVRSNAPRRYLMDSTGKPVLIGLTREETFEFERLDLLAPDQNGRQLANDENVVCSTGEQRWLELYEKHDTAWKAWIAQSRAEQSKTFIVS